MKSAFFLLTSLAVLCTGCASTDSNGASGAPSVTKDSESSEREHKIKIARERLEIAELESQAFELQHQNELRYAQADVAMAEAKLAKFKEVDGPSRVASEALDLQTTKDRAQEAKEELEQIEIMYEDQDLDDLTAEFVVSRGRRSAERAQARIAIQEARFSSLKERELPQEEQALVLALEKARNALEKAELDFKIGMQKKSIAIDEARNELEKLQREQAKS